MTAPGYVHGGSDEREVMRLEKQAAFTSPWIYERFDAASGMRVLDLATGVGAMAAQLLQRFPGVQLVGIDLSASQLAWARRNHPDLPIARANGAALPFADRTFDRVHCSWLLEHVPSAVAVEILRDVRRVLKDGGYCHFTEVDNATFDVEPSRPAVMKLMQQLNDAQERGGGDPYVGPKVEGYMRTAGFSRIDSRRKPFDCTAEDLEFFTGITVEFAEIFEGLDETVNDAALIHQAASDLRQLPSVPGSRMRYAGVIAQAWR